MKTKTIEIIDADDLMEELQLQYGADVCDFEDMLNVMFYNPANDSIMYYYLETDIETVENSLEKTILSYLQDIFPDKSGIWVKMCW